MKKMICLLTLVCAMIAMLGSVLLVYSSVRVRPFSVDAYKEYIELFPWAHTTAPIESARDARISAKQIWQDTYADVCNESHQPYVVSFDPIAEVWMVEGTMLFLHEGGVPHVLIRSNGEVIALWHDR